LLSSYEVEGILEKEGKNHFNYLVVGDDIRLL